MIKALVLGVFTLGLTFFVATAHGQTATPSPTTTTVSPTTTVPSAAPATGHGI